MSRQRRKRRNSLAAGVAAALVGAAIAPAAFGVPAVEHQGATPQLRLTTTSTTISVAAGQTVSRTILCPRGRTPLWWGFIGSSQTGRTVTAADLDQVLAVRSTTRAGVRVTFTGAAAAAVRAVVDLTCAQGRRGLVTRLTPRGQAARQTPTQPTLTVTSRLNSRRLAAGAARSVTVLCRAGALASTYGYVERGASVQGAIPVARGARQGFRVRFKNTSGQPARVTAQALCHEVSRLHRTTNRTLGVQQAAQRPTPPETIARGYIAIDNVLSCSTIFPNQNDCSVAIAENARPRTPLGGGLRPEFDGAALWGDWFALPDNRAIGDTLVHIETNGAANGTTFSNDYTFYGRYANGRLGSQSGLADSREPLSRAPYMPFVTGNSSGGQRSSQAPSPPTVVGRVTLSTPFLSATGITIVDARRPRPVSEIEPAPATP